MHKELVLRTTEWSHSEQKEKLFFWNKLFNYPYDLKETQIISRGRNIQLCQVINVFIVENKCIMNRVGLRADKLFWGSFPTRHVLHSLWYQLLLYASIPKYKSTFWQTLDTRWVMINGCCPVGLTPVIFYLIKIRKYFFTCQCHSLSNFSLFFFCSDICLKCNINYHRMFSHSIYIF